MMPFTEAGNAGKGPYLGSEGYEFGLGLKFPLNSLVFGSSIEKKSLS